MSKFEQKYTDADFLKVIEGDSKTTGFIAKAVGAARSTTVLWLEKLQNEGKIEKESIDDGNLFVWKLKKN
jgi:hypothetical protein